MKTQINLKKALKERDEGIARVSSKNGTFLRTARSLARMVFRRKGYVTADDVKKETERVGIKPTHFNAYGGVFKSSEFKAVGYVTSKQVQAHGNRICKWVVKC